MTDAYLPPLSDFAFSAEEEAAIVAAMLEDSPWDKVPAAHKDAIKSAKQRIQTYHLTRHNHQCCYCRTILHGGGYFMIDREHVLPKSIYRPFTFAPWNLSVSCKRCNMQFKKDCVAFVIDADGAGPDDTGANYRLVHPNFDAWDHHLLRTAVQAGGNVLVKFTVLTGSAKGAYHHEYFALKELEIDTFDQAQGMEAIAGSIADQIRKLARQHGQAN
ncbi:hypothetical protein ASE85_18765 [Sphingobium sp. Leaf26]|uniref:HNH endonuclease n=1 Tax=Sphingobium sp. Leaf26 TaxID=1735693 RepID=UPI0006FCF668|nr:hypothetical protein [Sphingobium sp. Leaf26]KQN07116.1 hypothetical protein ASE85_18765 [Sphingobium sp. Leaf26]